MSRILVVGGNSGIGAAVVARLDNGEHDIVVPDVSGDGRSLVFELDVRSEMSIENFFNEHGWFDCIVYTAGVNNPVWMEDILLHQMIEDFTVNAFGFALVLGAHARMFGKERLVSAVAITSDAARNAMRGSTSYCGSKAAIEHMVRTIAREWMPHTRVNGVAPASVEGTPMSDRIDSKICEMRGWTLEEAHAYEMKNLMMGRRVRPDEIAEVVEHTLFGPAYQTGSIVHITGGK